MTPFVLYDPLFQRHLTGPDHPECPQRLASVVAAVGYTQRPCRKAEVEDLQRVHTPGHVARVLAQRGKWGSAGEETPLSPDSVDAALLAAGAAIEGVERVLRGERGIVAARPPGHHALPDTGMGFCVFNNVAVAAAFAKTLGVERIAILDWDVHHGNGTQEIFYEDPSVYFFSVHQSPLYPDSGFPSERGGGRGLGYNRNVPLPAGSDDADYLRVFQTILTEDLAAFRPQLILVSAGFDAHQGDPLAGMWLTADGFGALCGVVRSLADRHAEGRLLLLLEGGYRLDTLGNCVAACLATL